MKRILFLLLLTVSVYGQNPSRFAKIQITGNANSVTATKVNVQEADGVVNTIAKNDLIDVVEVNDVPSLPLVGDVGKIYVVKNLNKIYRWNGTFYQELAVTDISGLQAQIDLKANDSDVLHKTGNETKNGDLSIIGTTSVKSANPKGSFHVFTGTSGSDIDVVGQENGSISFSNSGVSTASPAIVSKSNDAQGLTILTGTNNTNPSYDIGFQVSENDNTDFSTLTTKAYSFKRHNTELFSIYRNGKSEFLNQVKSTGGNFIVGTNSETGIASFYNNKNVTQHADYGFLEDSDLNYSGVGLQGHASFADNLKISGIQDSDHHNSFQAYPYYQNSGTITYLKGFFMQPSVTAGTVTNLFEFEANDPIGVGGTITNLHGVHVKELTKGVNNYAFFSEGATPSFIGGTYLGNIKVGIGGTITPTANLEVIDSNQTASGDGNVTIRTTDSQAADKGGLLTFGGSFSGTSRTVFGGISGRKENSTNGNVAGYLSLYSSSPTLGLVEAARINSNGTTNFNYSVTAPTAPAGTNTTQVATTAFVQAAALPYKLYTFYVNQSGANIPTSVKLSNNTTLSSTPTWERTGVGDYRCFIGTVNITKVFPYAVQSSWTFGNDIYAASVQGQYIQITRRTNGVLTDGLNNILFEIRQYP